MTRSGLSGDIQIALTTRRFGRVLAWHPELSSTMDQAKALARSSAVAPGTVVIAERQTQGRGRLGRSFVSPPGGLYLTLILEPPGPAENGWQVGFAAALAARRAIQAVGGPDVEFDWPNDLVFGERKLAGILLELLTFTPEEGRRPLLLLGIGINLGPDPRAIDPAAAGPAGPVPGIAGDQRAAVAAAFLNALEPAVECCGTAAGWKEVLAEVTAFSRAALGRPVAVRTLEGQVVSGKGVGLRDDGAVLIELNDGTVTAVRYGERIYALGSE